MSADNGVYILQTSKGDGFEYRVKELAGIENIYWDGSSANNKEWHETNDEDVWIRNARQWWAGCKVFTDKIEALLEAERQAKDYYILEYGISTITINREF